MNPSASISASERELADADAVFAALAHASRRHVLLVLRLRGGAMTAGEIADRFSCSWPTTTRHLRVLESAGLVQVEQRGRERVYRLRDDRLLAVTGGWLRWFGARARSGANSGAGAARARPRRRRRVGAPRQRGRPAGTR